MSAQHTPGPWQFVAQADWPHKQTVYVTAKGFGAVATVNIDPSLPLRLVEQERANLRLIAAAPELLEALEECASWLHDAAPRHIRESARAAIAKATGFQAPGAGDAA